MINSINSKLDSQISSEENNIDENKKEDNSHTEIQIKSINSVDSNNPDNLTGNSFYSPLNNKPTIKYSNPTPNADIPDDFTLFSHEKNTILPSLCVIKSDLPFSTLVPEKLFPTFLFNQIKNSLMSPFQTTSISSKEKFQYKGYARILDHLFIDNPTEILTCHKFLSTFIYYSVRTQINSFTSESSFLLKSTDKEWGSLFRAFQMIYCKFFIGIQLKHYVKEKLKIDLKAQDDAFLYIAETNLTDLQYDLIVLFFDNVLSIKTLLTIDYFKDFLKSLPFLVEKEQQVPQDSFIIKSVIAPLSISSIINSYQFNTNLQVNYDEIAKEGDKHIEVVQAFNEIIHQFSLMNDCFIPIVFDSVISEREIITKCFIEMNPHYQSQQQADIQFNSKSYLMKEGVNALIFIHVAKDDVKLIEDYYQEGLREIFKIRHNLGFIAYNKKELAYMYFIGESQNDFIALNPKHCQRSPQSPDELLDRNSFDSFKPNGVNLLRAKPEDLSTCITIGFQFKSNKEYLELISDIKKYMKLNCKLFEYKTGNESQNRSAFLFSSDLFS